MMKNLSALLATAFICLQLCNGFVVSPNTSPMRSQRRINGASPSPLSLSEVDLTDAAIDARRLFFLWFFGGSGGGGIALAAFPSMYERFSDMRSLKDLGPTQGGDTIGLSPLCGYPRDLSRADVEKVLKNRMSVEQMVEKGPKDSFWAEKGYLRFEAFEAANKGCNPLAVRAIFDALTTSTSTVEPDVAQELLDEFKNDTDSFKKALLKSKFSGYSAIGLLLFLLGLAATVSAEALATGWFPEWPGLENFPVSLVDPGIWTIQDYWI